MQLQLNQYRWLCFETAISAWRSLPQIRIDAHTPLKGIFEPVNESGLRSEGELNWKLT